MSVMNTQQKNRVQGWCLDGRFQPSEHQTPTARFYALTPQSPNHVKVYLQAFTPLDFHEAPLVAVKTLLSFSVLSIPEDDVLTAVIRYVCRRLSLSTSHEIWTPLERQQAVAQLRQLIPFIRYLSLTSHMFLHVMESLGLTDEIQSINKYRYEALARQLSRKLTFEDIYFYYGSPEERKAVVNALRGNPVILQSRHPYRLEEPACLKTNSWAPRMLIEFDRRTDVLPRRNMELCVDLEGTQKLEGWDDNIWLRDGTVKTLVLDHDTVFIRVSDSPELKNRWGWKLYAIPLVYDWDYESSSNNSTESDS